MLVYQSQIYVLACGFVSSLVTDTSAAMLCFDCCHWFIFLFVTGWFLWCRLLKLTQFYHQLLHSVMIILVLYVERVGTELQHISAVCFIVWLLKYVYKIIFCPYQFMKVIHLQGYFLNPHIAHMNRIIKGEVSDRGRHLAHGHFSTVLKPVLWTELSCDGTECQQRLNSWDIVVPNTDSDWILVDPAVVM